MALLERGVVVVWVCSCWGCAGGWEQVPAGLGCPGGCCKEARPQGPGLGSPGGCCKEAPPQGPAGLGSPGGCCSLHPPCPEAILKSQTQASWVDRSATDITALHAPYLAGVRAVVGAGEGAGAGCGVWLRRGGTGGLRVVVGWVRGRDGSTSCEQSSSSPEGGDATRTPSRPCIVPDAASSWLYRTARRSILQSLPMSRRLVGCLQLGHSALTRMLAVMHSLRQWSQKVYSARCSSTCKSSAHTKAAPWECAGC